MEMSGSTVSNSWLASCLTSSVLPTPVGADEDEAGGAVAAGQVSPGALDGVGHGVYGLILADDMLFQGFFQALQAAVLGLFNFDGGDTGCSSMTWATSSIVTSISATFSCKAGSFGAAGPVPS